MEQRTQTFPVLLFAAAFAASAVNAAWPKGAQPFGRAVLAPKSGAKAQGTLDFAKTPAGLLVRGTVANLTPGKHGIHFHEKGDCSAPDATSAGEHYNPTGHKHNGPTDLTRHAGDLGNIVAGKDGTAKVEITIATPKDGGFPGWEDVVGKSVVVHEKADDLKTQPSGDSGGRVACGVVDRFTEGT